MKEFEIKGTVMPGFESVKRLYEHNMRTLAETNTQLCVYYGRGKSRRPLGISNGRA